jgi:hypothetical protein
VLSSCTIISMWHPGCPRMELRFLLMSRVCCDKWHCVGIWELMQL